MFACYAKVNVKLMLSESPAQYLNFSGAQKLAPYTCVSLCALGVQLVLPSVPFETIKIPRGVGLSFHQLVGNARSSCEVIACAVHGGLISSSCRCELIERRVCLPLLRGGQDTHYSSYRKFTTELFYLGLRSNLIV